MKKLVSFLIVMTFLNMAFAQTGSGTDSTAGADKSTVRHPASYKDTKTEVRPADDPYRNANKPNSAQRLDKKKSQSKAGNGVIDQNAPGGMGTPEVKK